MSDMTLPPLPFEPTEASADPEPLALAPAPASAPNPLPGQGQALRMAGRRRWPAIRHRAVSLLPEACEVEGLNGKTMTGRLVAFLPEQAQLQLRMPTARATVVLRFDQFRRLRLLHPLASLPSADGVPQAELLAQKPAVPFTVQLHGGTTQEGLTIGPPGNRLRPVRLRAAGPGRHRAAGVLPAPGDRQHEHRPQDRRDAGGAEAGHLRPGGGCRWPSSRSCATQKLGDMLVLRQVITHEELHSAIEAQAKMPDGAHRRSADGTGFHHRAAIADPRSSCRRPTAASRWANCW